MAVNFKRQYDYKTGDPKRLSDQLQELEARIEQGFKLLESAITLPRTNYRGIIDPGESPFMLNANESVSCNNNAPTTITIPDPATCPGAFITVMRRSVTANDITIIPRRGRIHTSSTYTMPGSRGLVLMQSDGMAWWTNDDA